MKYENNRDDKLEALIANTTKSNRWCVDFDPFSDHDGDVMKEGFVDNEHKKGNKNQSSDTMKDQVRRGPIQKMKRFV